MTVAQIALLRHGITTASGCYHGSTDIALSEVGLQQMRDATKGECWDLIYTSPLQRCATFAEKFAQQLGVECRTDTRLRELHFGDWEGRSIADLQQRDAEALGRFWNDPERYAPPAAEPLSALRERVLACCGEIACEARGQRVLIVTHGGPIRILLAQQRGLSLRESLAIEVPHAGRFFLTAKTECA